MPIYEYECPLCGLFEVVQKSSERALKANPDCKKKNCPKSAKRLISAAAFHLKGSGWYKTDYAASGSSGTAGNSGKKPKKGAEGEAASSSSDSATKSTEGAKSSETKAESKVAKTKAGGSCGSGCGCH